MNKRLRSLLTTVDARYGLKRQQGDMESKSAEIRRTPCGYCNVDVLAKAGNTMPPAAMSDSHSTNSALYKTTLLRFTTGKLIEKLFAQRFNLFVKHRPTSSPIPNSANLKHNSKLFGLEVAHE
jgi:hypothetical protein